MKRVRPSIVDVLWRSVRLRCPACGRSSIVARPFNIKHHCPSCRALFKREDGFFVGAIAVSVAATEAVILFIYVMCLLLLGVEQEQRMLNILFVVAVVFPLAFYHHGWGIWLGFDHLIEGLPEGSEKGGE